MVLHEVHNKDAGTSIMGVDNRGDSFLVPLTSAELEGKLPSRVDAEGASKEHTPSATPKGAEPGTGSSTPNSVELKAGANDVEQQKASSFTKQWLHKKKLEIEGMEQQAGSFTTQLNGYLNKAHWHQAKPPPKTQRKLNACLNLRDVGANMPALMKPGIVFRSSELLSADDMRRYGIQTILDLRRMDRPCKKKGKRIDKLRTAVRFARKGPKRLLSERLKPYTARGQPHACSLCRDRIHEKIGFEARSVVHADLIPTAVGLQLFRAMPASVKGQALLAALTGKGAASVMAPAVANPLYMGYKVMYRTVLESSKRGIAKAMRVFADKDNYPVLLHCIHGKDRTGIIVMLLLMLCGVESSIIVDDYMKSESVLKASRMHDELDLDVYLTSDAVIAATKETMEDTIKYIDDKYEGAAKYLYEAGLEDWELSKIRVNLLQKADTSDLLNRLSMLQPLSSHRQSGERGALQNLFSRNSNQRSAPLRRTTSQPTSDNLGNLRKRIQEGTNASTKAPPSALKNTASAPPISREEWNITRPSLGAAKNAVARKLDAGKDEAGGHKSSSTPALAEAGRSSSAAGMNRGQSPEESQGMASAWAQLIDASTPRDVDKGEIDKGPEAMAATDPNKGPAIPKSSEEFARQSNVSLAEKASHPAHATEHMVDPEQGGGAHRAASPDTHDSHAETALLNSKAVLPSRHTVADEGDSTQVEGQVPAQRGHFSQSNGISKPAGNARVSQDSADYLGLTAREV